MAAAGSRSQRTGRMMVAPLHGRVLGAVGTRWVRARATMGVGVAGSADGARAAALTASGEARAGRGTRAWRVGVQCCGRGWRGTGTPAWELPNEQKGRPPSSSSSLAAAG